MDPRASLQLFHSGHLSAASLIHYPAIPKRSLEASDGYRVPAHSDLSTLTILLQDGVGGLQMADMATTTHTRTTAVEQTASFIGVPPNNTKLLVCGGHMLSRWTGRLYKAAVHRVMRPPNSQGHRVDERYSVAFFCYPDRGTIITNVLACGSGDEAEPLNVVDYLLTKKKKMGP